MESNQDDHRSLALWTAECAEHVLPFFESDHPNDRRPRTAVEAARAWVRGEMQVSHARSAALAAHAAARAARQPAAVAAARAAGHAAATSLIPDHARHAATYAVKAAASSIANVSAERNWQRQRLARHLWALGRLDDPSDRAADMAVQGEAQDAWEIVAWLAMALDGDDFETVRLLLAHDCVYDLGGQSHVGADAIVRRYADGSKLARDLFESVDYSHELIGRSDDQTVRVHFLDSLYIKGETHVHVSRQDVTVDPERGVVRIVDTSEPKQQEAIDKFMACHGITRPHTG